MQVFISHSSNDLEIAKILIDLLQKSLNLRNDDIRCTSLDGYRMRAGASINETLRSEVHDAALLIGLITPSSINSAYVIFELGARWGAEKPIIPLLASGTTPEHLEGPLSGINALDSREEGQVHQLIEEAALGLQVRANNASSYVATIKELVRVSSESDTSHDKPNLVSAVPNLSEDAIELLSEAARDPHGDILSLIGFAGSSIQTNGKAFGGTDNRRSAARWKQALMELYSQGLITDPTGRGEVFQLTHTGFELADELGTTTYKA